MGLKSQAKQLIFRRGVSKFTKTTLVWRKKRQGKNAHTLSSIIRMQKKKDMKGWILLYR